MNIKVGIMRKANEGMANPQGTVYARMVKQYIIIVICFLNNDMFERTFGAMCFFALPDLLTMRDQWKTDYLELRNIIQPMSARSRSTNRPFSPSMVQNYAPRPLTAPEHISVDSVSSLVSRLTRPNTATAGKAVFWSTPRRRWEESYMVGASKLYKEGNHKVRYGHIQKHYPGPWTIFPSLQDQMYVNQRLSQPTVSSASRAEECISRRKFVEDFKAKNWAADIVNRDMMLHKSSEMRQ